jgi:hypothetical protein
MNCLLSNLAGMATAFFVIWWTAVPNEDVFSAGYELGVEDACGATAYVIEDEPSETNENKPKFK